MLFGDVAATLAQVRATRSRHAKRDALASCLRRAEPDEVAVVASFVSGSLTQRRTGVGWRSLSDLPGPADGATLGVLDVDAAFGRLAGMSGAGSQAARREELTRLFRAATEPEQQLLRGLVAGDIRTGALGGVLVDALAVAYAAPPAAVRRAAMLGGSTPHLAELLATKGATGLKDVGLAVGQGVQPMLAASAPDVAAALETTGLPALVDGKLDGIRIQVHRDGDQVQVFSRSLDDLSGRFPYVEEVARGLPCRRVVLDGEAMLIDAEGRPRLFQDTASASATRTAEAVMRPWFFDIVHLDGTDLLDLPLRDRAERLAALVPSEYVVPRRVVSTLAEAEAFDADVLARGHEGVVIKALDGPWEAGRRGSGWVKVKPVHTLDLVVLAVEHGSGRRRGWLSNIHLGARDGDGLTMLGKTFKGMSDEMLAWQTRRFRDLQVADDGRVVTLRPEQVVEVAFDGLQRSTRYPGGLALRFARVVRYREDKTAAEADTIETVRSLARS